MTPRERDLVEAIRRLTVNGVTPSYDQLVVALGLGSKSGVHRMVGQLVEKGVLRHGHGRRRNLVIVEDERAAFRLALCPDDQLRAIRDKCDALLAERAKVVRFPPRLRVAT